MIEPRPVTRLGTGWGLSREPKGRATLISQRKDVGGEARDRTRPRDPQDRNRKPAGQSDTQRTGHAIGKKCWGPPGHLSSVISSSLHTVMSSSVSTITAPHGWEDQASHGPGSTLEATSSSSDGPKGCGPAGDHGTNSPTVPAILVGPPGRAILLVLAMEHFHWRGIFHELCLQLGRRAKPLSGSRGSAQNDTGRCVSESRYHSLP